ncbi:hypothetical protein CBR_g50975 [Chara braunii]|uniref:Uncharacterized protein n=1 Tax=Chara braunii TaxID=69332 RepID=A0A388M7W0_CHABU|nr:hypothetical protein CBR_g50975 [Chara braunii]|eukprot:GBG90630.1 hypothetical protein CBR_g50975 [Chara braunii]
MARPEVEVTVKTLTGKAVRIELHESATVNDLMQRSEIELGEPQGVKYRLFLRGVRLESDKLIKSLNVKEGEAFVLIGFTAKKRLKAEWRSRDEPTEDLRRLETPSADVRRKGQSHVLSSRMEGGSGMPSLHMAPERADERPKMAVERVDERPAHLTMRDQHTLVTKAQQSHQTQRMRDGGNEIRRQTAQDPSPQDSSVPSCLDASLAGKSHVPQENDCCADVLKTYRKKGNAHCVEKCAAQVAGSFTLPSGKDGCCELSGRDSVGEEGLVMSTARKQQCAVEAVRREILADAQSIPGMEDTLRNGERMGDQSEQADGHGRKISSGNTRRACPKQASEVAEDDRVALCDDGSFSGDDRCRMKGIASHAGSKHSACDSKSIAAASGGLVKEERHHPNRLDDEVVGDKGARNVGENVEKEESDGEKAKERMPGHVTSRAQESKAQRGPGGKGGGRSASRSDKEESDFVWPPDLERLIKLFDILNSVYGFLQRQHVQATWRNVRAAMEQLSACSGLKINAEDVAAMATLCPRIVWIRDKTGEGESLSFTIDLVDPTRPLSDQLMEAQIMPPTPAGETEPWDLIPAGGRKLTNKMIQGPMDRRRRGFQETLMGLLQARHRQFLAQLGVKENRGKKRSKSSDWHPDFQLSDVSLADLLSDACSARAANPAVDRSTGEVVGSLPSESRHDTGEGYGSNAKSLWERFESAEVPARPPRVLKKIPRCTSTKSYSPAEMLDHLREGLGSVGQVTHCQYKPPRKPSYGSLERPLSEATIAALKKKKIADLYVHQTSAINAIVQGRHVVVATSTASGKSLCYNIPVLEAFSSCPDTCALYMFPTKALAQDQLRALVELTSNMPVIPVMGVYDGDTPQDRRPSLRNEAQLLITNPDMLHVSILPVYQQFKRFLSSLKYVVVDEAHMYRGVFGCHTALIIRRLRRICSRVFGVHPTFVVCSATVANPKEHAQELIGLQDIEVVLEDGSPCAEKYFVLWNPPLIMLPQRKSRKRKSQHMAKKMKAELKGTVPRTSATAYNYNDDNNNNTNNNGPVDLEERPQPLGQQPTEEGAPVQSYRSSPIVEVALLMAEMVQHGLRCLAFCTTRKLCELVLVYASETLKETAPHLADSIRSYRAGYTPEDRRAIEADLFGGMLRGVAATNALELGVDVGSLDVTLHLGFPGTVASLWQQSGRAGRREQSSLAIYVAFNGPLDQYFMRNPEKLFSRPIENAQVDAHNPQAVDQHLVCAAAELPIQVDVDDVFFGAGVERSIALLVEKGLLGRHPTHPTIDSAWHYIGKATYPSHGVSIRSIDPGKYVVVNEETNDVIEEIEENKAFFEVYDGAVYMHQGKTYLVKTVNINTKEAIVRQATLNYYTKMRDLTDVQVMGGALAYPCNIAEERDHLSSTAQCTMAKVITQFLGFRRVWQGTNQVFDQVDLFLPSVEYTTQASWIRIPRRLREKVQEKGVSFRDSLHAACHAVINVLPLYVMCNVSDVGTECASPHDTRYFPERILIYDRHPGGIGISSQARVIFAELLQAAVELVTSCNCTIPEGCPNCVQYFGCGEYNHALIKEGAIIILQGVVAAESAYRDDSERPESFHYYGPDGEKYTWIYEKGAQTAAKSSVVSPSRN